MPFRSVKQRNFLRWKHPEIYRRWKRKYGTTIRPRHRQRKRHG